MSILSTNNKLIKVGQDYSAGDNISIYEQNEQLYISSKDWTNDIANASANAYNEAVAKIPDPFDPTFISGQVDNKLDTTAFTNWQNGQYTTDLQTIEGQISNKLDKSEFSQVSSTFLTSINIPESAVWQDVSTTVQSNSAQWAEGGGGSVSSKYGTISVDGSDIEATNKAIEFKRDGFTSAFEFKMVNNYEPLVLTWDDYSEGTIIHVNAFNMDDATGTLTYSSNTNVTGEIITGAYGSYLFDVQIPSATAIQFTTDKTFLLQENTRVSALSSYKVSELAWKTDLPTYTYNSDNKVSAINGSALVGNEDYLVKQGFVQNLTSPKGTISVLNNNNVEGTNSAIAGDVIEGFVSAYYRIDVIPGKPSTLTWERYLPNTRLFVSGGEYHQDHTLNYSADTSVTGVITVPTGGQVSIELPTDSKSIVIGNEKWDVNRYNFTVSAADYYEIGELAWKSDIPTYDYDSTNKISAINGSAIGGGVTGDAQGAVDTVYSTSGNIITGTKSDYNFTAGNVTNVTFGNFTINGVRTYIEYDRPGFPTDRWIIGNFGFHLGPEFADDYWENYSRVWLERTGLSSMSGTRSDKKLIWRALLDNDVEGANNTITAIAGSAIGGGVTGEFVPQSAFDELKASYDALSSLFATYSGQWLLPNEGV